MISKKGEQNGCGCDLDLLIYLMLIVCCISYEKWVQRVKCSIKPTNLIASQHKMLISYGLRRGVAPGVGQQQSSWEDCKEPNAGKGVGGISVLASQCENEPWHQTPQLDHSAVRGFRIQLVMVGVLCNPCVTNELRIDPQEHSQVFVLFQSRLLSHCLICVAPVSIRTHSHDFIDEAPKEQPQLIDLSSVITFMGCDHFHGLWAESNWDLKYTKESNTLKPSTTSIPTNCISSDSGCILDWSFCYSSPVVTRRLKQIPSTLDSHLLSLLNDLAKKNIGLSLCSPRCLSRENTHYII
jgi:hypothetical protein